MNEIFVHGLFVLNDVITKKIGVKLEGQAWSARTAPKGKKNKASMATSLEKKVSPSFPRAIISLSLEMILKIEPRNSEDLLGIQILFQLLKKSLQIFLFLLPPRPSPSRFDVHKYPETFIFFQSWIKIKEIRLLFLWVAFS